MLRQYARYMGLAALLPAATFVGYMVGYWLDQALGTTYLRIIFVFLGIASGLITLIRDLSKDVRGPKS